MDNQFDNSGPGEQNIAQGDGAIGKQENVTQEVRGHGNIFSGTGNVTVNGISPAVFAEYAGKLAVTETALASFFKIMEEQQVPLGDLDSKLRDIAGQYKELLARLETVQSADPQVQRLKDEARQAIEAGDYAKAEELLNQAEARDVQAIEQLEDAARQRRISAAASCVDNAKLQEVQLRYAKAAAYWQKAAALLPEDKKKERSLYLHEAGYDLQHISKYSEALSLYKQSLCIRQEIDDRAGEGTTLNNISQIYRAKGNYDEALKYLIQTLVLFREIGDREREGRTLDNIGRIYYGQEDYATALNYFEQSLAIRQEIGSGIVEWETLGDIAMIHYAKGDYDKALPLLDQHLAIQRDIGDRDGEGITLSNIGLIYDALGDYVLALTYLEQSLTIQRDIGYKAGEAVTSWNIGRAYEGKGDLAKAEEYMSRAVQIDEKIGRPELDRERKHLAAVRAKLRGK